MMPNMVEKKIIAIVVFFSVLVIIAFVCGLLFGIDLGKQIGYSP